MWLRGGLFFRIFKLCEVCLVKSFLGDIVQERGECRVFVLNYFRGVVWVFFGYEEVRIEENGNQFNFTGLELNVGVCRFFRDRVGIIKVVIGQSKFFFFGGFGQGWRVIVGQVWGFEQFIIGFWFVIWYMRCMSAIRMVFFWMLVWEFVMF